MNAHLAESLDDSKTIHFSTPPTPLNIIYGDANSKTTTNKIQIIDKMTDSSLFTTTTSTIFSPTIIAYEPIKSTPLVEVFFDEELLSMESSRNKDYYTDASFTPSTTPYFEKPIYTPKKPMPTYTLENLDFMQQLDMFTSRTLCIIRAVFVLWCCAQIISTVPFLLGICLKCR